MFQTFAHNISNEFHSHRPYILDKTETEAFEIDETHINYLYHTNTQSNTDAINQSIKSI